MRPKMFPITSTHELLTATSGRTFLRQPSTVNKEIMLFLHHLLTLRGAKVCYSLYKLSVRLDSSKQSVKIVNPGCSRNYKPTGLPLQAVGCRYSGKCSTWVTPFTPSPVLLSPSDTRWAAFFSSPFAAQCGVPADSIDSCDLMPKSRLTTEKI